MKEPKHDVRAVKGQGQNDAKTVKTQPVRLPRQIANQNKTGHGNPHK